MGEFILKAVMVLVPMILSLTVHEYAHARAAYFLGDDTARRMGRMTLNPLSHIDVFGTIVLPILAIWSGGPFFGWAKPVPINPLYFTHKIRMKTGILITAAAGPLSNIGFAFLLAFILNILSGWGIGNATLIELVSYMFIINIVLAIFNLIPVPPLDGSKVLVGLLPDKLSYQYAYLERNPFFVIFAFAILITLAGKILNVPVKFLAKFILVLTGNDITI